MEFARIPDAEGILANSTTGKSDTYSSNDAKRRLANGTAGTAYDDANLLLKAAPMAPFTDVHVERGQEKPRGGWYSDSYGKIEPAPALSQSLRTRLPWHAATLLFPYKGTATPEVAFSFDGRRAEIRHPEIGSVAVECSLPR